MPRALVRAVVAGSVAWVAFSFRFQQQPGFHNDHFEHLAMARQVLFGELPGRDFFDPGRPLTVLLSAAAQALFGHSLFGEALLTIGALALGATIVFWLASGIARSVVAGALGALLVIAMSPRLYSYPKVIVFAAALLVLWRYVDRPSIGRAIVLAVVTVFALLMRHDFGVYVGAVSTCGIVLVGLKPDTTSEIRPGPDITSSVGSGFGRIRWRPLAAYVVATVVLASPYLAWMQQNGLLAASAAGGVGSLAGAAGLTWRPLRVDLSNGLVHLDPVRGHLAVRWSEATTPDVRAALEQRYGLIQGHVEGDRVLSYGMTDDSRENIRALVADLHVDDTSGISRGAAMLDAPAWRRWLSRLVVGPFFTGHDAEAWLYYLFWLIPVAALAIIGLQVTQSGLTPAFIKVGVAALLGVLLNLFLLRGSLDSRLPDVVVPPAIVGVWLLADLARKAHRRAAAWRLSAAAVVATAGVLVGSAVSAHSRVTMSSLLTAPTSLSRLQEVAERLRMRPIEMWAPPGSVGIERLTRYVFECTAAEDRLLLVAYEPGVFYYAERLFAGGIEHFHQRRFSSAADQARIVADLGRQRVPLVIVEDDRFRMLQEDYAQVFAYISSRYVPVAETTFQAQRRWRIYSDRSVPTRRNWDDLPCFVG